MGLSQRPASASVGAIDSEARISIESTTVASGGRPITGGGGGRAGTGGATGGAGGAGAAAGIAGPLARSRVVAGGGGGPFRSA